MDQLIQEAGQQAMREALKQTIRQWEGQQRVCPHYAEQSPRLEGTTRRVIATRFGRVGVPRRRFRCQGCGRRWRPATGSFAALPGGTISVPLQEAGMLAGCSWPYRVTSTQLKRLSGVCISAEEIRRLTNQQGKLRAAAQQAEAEHLCTRASPAQESTEAQSADLPMLVRLDGGWVCSRKQRGGMEGKVALAGWQVADPPMPIPWATFSWSQRGVSRAPKKRHRLVKRRHVATFGSLEQLGTLAAAAAKRVREEPPPQVLVLADGAKWIKAEQARHFPQATCILDWTHLWREVRHAIRVAAWAKSLSKREHDYQLLLYRAFLWHGEVEHSLHGLRTLATGLPAEPLETATNAMTYLENQRPWIGSDEQWKKLSYPMGSGMIGRAVSLVINRRMKKRGMRWCRLNAAVVALRADLINDDWSTPQRLRAFP